MTLKAQEKITKNSSGGLMSICLPQKKKINHGLKIYRKTVTQLPGGIK